MGAFIEARALYYTVGHQNIVENATISLPAGRLIIVVGPNGAGKSTLLRLLSGELRPTSGSIVCAGEKLQGTPTWRLARRRAVMAQATQLAFPFTVNEVVRIGLETLGANTRGSEADAIVAQCLRRADILQLACRKYHTLSGGEQQRTHFARVLCQLAAGRRSESAQALYLDEPVASLDLRHQLMLLDAAREIAKSGIAVMAILHDLNLAVAYADELVVMHAGRIVASGNPADVLAGGIVADVFGVDLRLCATPPGNTPFVLPHGHARRVAWRLPTPPVENRFQPLPIQEGATTQRSEPRATLPGIENTSMSFSFWP
ncbi:MAG: heme ABC transporter ATP-binding protein [Alphaproteobacteria bacterium]|nr:heme ABC transporter ATP-binding protein [Alphaproteobacteria bacterium]MBM3639879.1 heme ABC transporter ATP-binding protein [Alphaproteobacteria bacterium]